jgi:cyclophilin family peptidyl-prolyl cis-trans isomerase
MKIKAAVILLLLVAAFGSLSCRSAASNDELAVIETNYGQIVIEFFPQEAPRHVANFKELAEEGFYNGTRFHRVVKDGAQPVVIQGGDPNTINGDPATWGQGQPGQKTVPAEFSKTLLHERGIVSAARRPDDDNSASSQFFICLKPRPDFDGRYSIFGKVVEGMNVVEAIGRAPVFRGTDRPLDPVVVNRVYLKKREAR